VTAALEQANGHHISHLWSTPVVFPFYRSYDVLWQSSAACKALKVLKTTVLKRLRSAIWHPAGVLLTRMVFRGFGGSSPKLLLVANTKAPTVMQAGMACVAERNQVLF